MIITYAKTFSQDYRSLLEPRFEKKFLAYHKGFTPYHNKVRTSAVALKNIPQALKDWFRRRRISAPREKKILPLEQNYSGSERQWRKSYGAGFTMIEILVVISIMILLSSLLILYSRTGENQIILFRDQSRLITSLNMAKSLSIQRFNASSPSCAFGVHFSKTENAFLIFRDLAADCQNADHVYTDSGELFENYQLSSRIKFGETTLTDIIFTPPDPKILIDNDSNKIEATITLETLDGNASLKVKVNNAGQITTQ